MKTPIILSLGLLAFTGFAENPRFTVDTSRSAGNVSAALRLDDRGD